MLQTKPDRPELLSVRGLVAESRVCCGLSSRVTDIPIIVLHFWNEVATAGSGNISQYGPGLLLLTAAISLSSSWLLSSEQATSRRPLMQKVDNLSNIIPVGASSTRFNVKITCTTCNCSAGACPCGIGQHSTQAPRVPDQSRNRHLSTRDYPRQRASQQFLTCCVHV